MNKKALVNCAIFLFLSLNQLFSQVNLQTGAAQVKMPLFNIQDTKSGLSSGVSLDYIDGSGINVDEIASNAGTGWALICGGVITRSMVGQADDQKYPGTLPSNDYTYQTVYPSNFANGFLYSPYTPGSAIPGFAAQHWMFPQGVATGNLTPALQTTADREQDIFTFSFNGRIGQFYIGKDKSISQVLNSKLKITFEEQDMTSLGIRTTISKFVITDENGNIYTFSDLGTNSLMTYSYNAYAGIAGVHVYDGTPSQYLPKYVSNWYLTSIKNPFTSDEIDFIYTSYNVDITGARHLVKSSSPQLSNVANYTMHRDHYQYTAKRITRINFPNHQSLLFSYNPLPRADLPGDNALNSIALVSNYSGTDKSEYYYQFNFGYFYQNQILPYNYSFSTIQQSFARLCLQSVQKYSADGTLNIPPTTFSYNLSLLNPLGIPGIIPAQFSLNRDMWGYYSLGGYAGSIADVTDNVTVHPSAIGADAFDNIDFQRLYGQLGMINKITYATGGSLSFTYEQNKAINSNISGNFAQGVRVNSINIDDGYGNVKQLNYKYIKADGTISGKGFEAPAIYSTPLQRIYKSTSSLVAVEIKDVASVAISACFYDLSQIGLRVFTKGLFESVCLFIDIYDLIKDILYAVAPASQDQTTNVTTYDNQNLSNPLPIMYSRVEVQETSNGVANGKTVYELSSFDDYPPLISSFPNIPNSNAPLITSQQRFASWEYGHTKKIQYFDNTVNPQYPIKEIINTYTPYVSISSNPLFLSTAWAENTGAYTPYDYTPSSVSSSFITSTTYFPITGRMELTKTVENIYDKTGNVFGKTINYSYNTTNYQLNKTESFNTSNSNEVFGKVIYYPSDYDPSINLTATLLNKNVFNLPVTIADYKKNGASQPVLTNATVNIFSQLNNGEIKTAQVFGLESATPVSNSFVSNFSSTTAPNGYSYLALKKAFSYDDAGALVATTQNGQTESYITSYKGRYNIAKAFNVNYNDIAYTGFEDDNNGNWNYSTTTSAIINTFHKTGISSYQLSTTPSVTVTSKQTLSAGNTYAVSLWLNTGSGTCLVNGVSVNPILNNIDGWTYCTLNISGVTSVTISGTGIIDEVRLYPVGSQMNSYTYDLMKGITSQADAANRIVYNQYDGLGRLDRVLDQDRNISKKYNYNYAGQQTNYAGLVFYNLQQIGYFKGSCTAGYISDFVPYTINPNKYPSIISQVDADQQATNEMNLNGQSNANAHPACRLPQNISITYNNATSSHGYIKFTNRATNVISTFDLLPNQPNGTIAGSIPQGIYDIYMYSGGSGNFYYRVYNYIQTGQPTWTLTGIDFSAANITTETLTVAY